MTNYKQESREAFGKASGMKQAGTGSADNDAVVKNTIWNSEVEHGDIATAVSGVSVGNCLVCMLRRPAANGRDGVNTPDANEQKQVVGLSVHALHRRECVSEREEGVR